MELPGAIARFRYPNDIGPVVYDFQTPQVPTQEDVEQLLGKARRCALTPSNSGSTPIAGSRTGVGKR